MIYDSLRQFQDIHTHTMGNPEAVCSVSPLQAIEMCKGKKNQPYSIMLHPWYASETLLSEFLQAVEFCANDPMFIAIGECGLDTNCNTPLPLQKRCFAETLRIAESLKKPVVIHIVKAWDEMFRLVKEFGDISTCPMIIHGYRKNATLAKQLVEMGYYISLGKKFNAEVLKAIPKERIFRESDDESAM